MIVEIPALDRVRGPVGIEEPYAFPAFEAKARIDEAIGSSDPKLTAEGLARRIVVRIERSLVVRIAASQVMQPRVNSEHDLPKL